MDNQRRHVKRINTIYIIYPQGHIEYTCRHKMGSPYTHGGYERLLLSSRNDGVVDDVVMNEWLLYKDPCSRADYCGRWTTDLYQACWDNKHWANCRHGNDHCSHYSHKCSEVLDTKFLGPFSTLASWSVNTVSLTIGRSTFGLCHYRPSMAHSAPLAVPGIERTSTDSRWQRETWHTHSRWI